MGGWGTKQAKRDDPKEEKLIGEIIKIRLIESKQKRDATEKEERKDMEASFQSARVRKREEENAWKERSKEAKQEKPLRDKGQSESFLLNNGIISRINGSLLCALCDAKLTPPEVSNHAKLKSHTVRLAIFQLCFINQRLDVFCKTCGSKFAWEELKIHAQRHCILPWHKPSDLYMTLFKHRVSQHLGNFYCYTCKEIFSDWFDAHSHTSRSLHKTLSKAWLVPPVSCDNLASIYELSVRNAIFAVDSGHAECKICRCRIVANAVNVAAHVVGSQHTTAQPEFAKFLVDAGKRDLMKVNAIQMTANGKYRCTKCAHVIETFDQVMTHVTEESHGMNHGTARARNRPIASKRESLTRDGATVAPVSRLADRGIGNAAASKQANGATAERVSRLTVRGTGNAVANKPPGGATGGRVSRLADRESGNAAARKLPNGATTERVSRLAARGTGNAAATKPPVGATIERVSELADRRTENAAANESDGATCVNKVTAERTAKLANGEDTKSRRVSAVPPRDYIFRRNSTTSVCNLCEFSITSRKNVNDHLAGSNHTASMRKYRCDLIDVVTLASPDYYCNACKCHFSGFANLWRHTLGTRHVTSVASPDERSTVGNKAESVVGCLRSTAKPKISKPVSSKRPYNTNEKTQCDVCRQKFPNDLVLHAHMAGHYSLEFMSSVAAAQDGFLNGEDHGHVVKDGPTVEDENQDSTSSDGLEEGPDERSMRCGLSQNRKIICPEKMRKIVAILTSENDDIYTMKDKLREFELATRLSYEAPNKDGRIYCLVCMILTEFTADNYLEHLISLNHSVWLEKMERDHARFEKFPDQFSAIDLGVEYMVEHEGRVYCHPCDRFIDDLDHDLRGHVGAKRHVKAREAMRDHGAARFDLLTSSYICNWYKVQLYCCIPCFATFRYEVNFSKHLASDAHAKCMKNPPNTSRQLVFDFCTACALLWYGYRRTSAYHRLIGSHSLLDRDGHYKSVELTEKTRQLLRDPKLYVDEFVERCEIEGQRERDKEATIVRDIQAAVRGTFPEAKAHLFGSRVTGLGSLGCDIDVFLDCGNLYSGSKSSRGAMLKLIRPVAAHLKNFSDCWVIEELLTACRSPIIRAYHKVTEFDCDISFENGLAVENTKLIRSYNQCFPPCRQMIIFLKRWMTLCGLTGTGRITSYALYWHVIFYLQHESILPSVAELIAKQNMSCKIDGWEVGVSSEFTCNGTSTDPSLCTLLTGFFRFWSNFDHRRDVACPLIGKSLKKTCFVDCDELPVEMKPYVDYLNKPTSGSISEPFRIDSDMCIQDPFDLQHNLTKAVRKVYLKRFREYCSLSHEILVAL